MNGAFLKEATDKLMTYFTPKKIVAYIQREAIIGNPPFKTMKTINQKHYKAIEVDTAELDIVQIWQNGDVIQVEREHIEQLIEILMKEMEK